jgi:hypothetical protein
MDARKAGMLDMTLDGDKIVAIVALLCALVLAVRSWRSIRR